MPHTVFYARLSNQRSANEPSVEYQLGLLIAEARRAGETFDEMLWTAGGDLYVEGIGRHSGHGLKQRPAMQAILKRIEERGDISVFRALDIERTARDAEFTLKFFRTLRERHISPQLLRDPGLSGDDANSVAMLGFRAVAAEFYRNYVKDMRHKYQQQAHDEGWIHNATAPAGLLLTGSKSQRRYAESTRGVWITAAGDVSGDRDARPFARRARAVFHSYLDTIRRACELLSAGATMQQSCRQLREERYYWSRHDGTPILCPAYHFSADKLLPILPRYRPFLGSALVDTAIRQVQSRAHHRANGRRFLEPAAIPALWRLVYCGQCNRRLVFGYRDRSRRHAGYYSHHNSRPCDHNRAIAHRAFETRVLAEIGARLSPTALHRVGPPAAAAPPSRGERVSRLQKLLDGAKDKFLRDLISESDYARYRRQFESEIAAVRREPENDAPSAAPCNVDALIANLTTLLQEGHRHPDLLNAALRETFERVVVAPDLSFRIEPRAWASGYWRSEEG